MLLKLLLLYYICASLQDLKCLQTAVSSEDGEVHSSILEMIQCHEWDAPLLHLPLLPHLDRMLLWSRHHWPQSQWEHLEEGQKTLRMWFWSSLSCWFLFIQYQSMEPCFQSFTLFNCCTGSGAHGEQAHKCLEQTQRYPDYPTHVLPLLI